MLRNIGAVLGAAAICALAGTPAGAQSVEEFYRGKTITIVSPFAPGGTTAGLAQLFVDHLGKHIPGNPTLTVEFMPGGGGMIGQNFAYNQSPRDGTAIFMPQDSSVVLQLLEPDTAKYDAAKINWIGNVLQSKHILGIRKDTGVTSIEDLKTKEVFIGSSGAGSETDVYPRITNAVLGTIMNVIPGYPGGSAEGMVALEAGEISGAVAIMRTWSQRPDLFAEIVPVLVYGSGRLPALPDVPNLAELVTDAEDQKIVRFISSIGPIGRALAAPPEVPQDRVDALRAAFAAMLKDPEFITGLSGFNLKLDEPLNGVELQQAVIDALDVSPEVIERTRKLIAVPQ